MAKKDTEKKKEIALLYYLRGENQKTIAEQLDINRATVARWITDGKWAERRAAENITRPEIVNKLLLTIDKLITQVNESDDITLINGIGDKLSKLSSVISKLDKKTSVVDTVEVCMGFGKFLRNRAAFDSDITPALENAVNKYQNIYIGECFGKN